MKYKISLCISALCFFTAFLILMASRTTGEEALASRIAPEILRFHVRQCAPCLHCELAEYHVQIAVLRGSTPGLALRTLDNGPTRHQSVCTSLEALPVDVGV